MRTSGPFSMTPPWHEFWPLQRTSTLLPLEPRTPVLHDMGPLHSTAQASLPAQVTVPAHDPCPEHVTWHALVSLPHATPPAHALRPQVTTQSKPGGQSMRVAQAPSALQS
jgi:hypothetical protein